MIADAGDSESGKMAFKRFSESLRKIAEENYTAGELKQLWALATRLVAFGEKVQRAFSKENQENIENAIKELASVL